MFEFLKGVAALGFEGAYARLVWHLPAGYRGLSAKGQATLQAALIGFASRD